MNEVDKLHFGDWFAAWVAFGLFIGGSILTWLGSWIKERRTLMRERLEKIETGMSSMNEKMAKFDEQIAVAETNMEHIQNTIKDVKKSTEVCTQLLHDLLLKIAK